MKKISYRVMAVSFLFSLIGVNSSVDRTPCEIAEAIMQSQTEIPSLIMIISQDKDFIPYLDDYYHIESEQIINGVIYYADGVEATEIAVLILRDEKNISTIQNKLEKYIIERASVFEGYAPIQAEIAKNGFVISNKKYIALVICKDFQSARRAFLSCFDEKAVAEAASKIDEYDSDALLYAWRSGDDRSLSKINLDILNASKKVLQEIIKENMTDYEKELAVHDWITNYSSFDYSVFNRSNKTKPGTDTPYGVLVLRKAMCHGYSSTFQLFMDMLNIKCITVFGIPDSRGVQHSWNMVQLDGEWYCVDTAWDDPIGGNPNHRFFNVTSDTLRNSGIHHWNEKNIPEATAITYNF